MGDALAFHRAAFEALYDADALAVFARGLGAYTLLRKLIAVHCEPAALTFVLNIDPEEQAELMAELGAEGTRFLPRAITTEEALTATQRERIYAQGGVVFVSSRSLVTDLLQGRVPAAALQTVLVWRAHQVRQDSLEALALRLVRGLSARVQVKAITDNAEQAAAGRVERLLRALTVRDVVLYPRFHEEVKAALEPHSVDMIDCSVAFAPLAQRLHEKLLDTMREVLGELRLAVPEAEAALFAVPADDPTPLYSADARLRGALDGPRMAGKARQLVEELAVLRRLVQFVPRYEPVAFLRFFDVVRRDALETHAAHWPFYLAGQEAWRIAQRRVFCTRREGHADGGGREPDVEVPAKWPVLRRALREIAALNAAHAPVLILARDAAAVRQTMDVLRLGEAAHLAALYDEWDAAQRAAPSSLYPAAAASPRGRGRGSRARGGRGRGGGRGTVNAATIAPAVPKAPRLTPGKRGPPPPPDAPGTLRAVLARRAEPEGEIIELSSDRDPPHGASDAGAAQAAAGAGRLDSDEGVVEVAVDAADEAGGVSLLASNVFVRPVYAARGALWSLEPRFVVLCDIDLACIRLCECFRSARPGKALRVYLLTYEDSAEARAYSEAVDRENDAFAALIEEKARLVMPPSLAPLPEPAPDPPASLRNAAAAPARVGPPTVIVDTRELRPGIALPSLLHFRGMRLHAVALDAGDYVLTPELCVERKAIPDLIGSFADGRLYTQIERLARLYRRPVLLIEGNAEAPFVLQEEVADDVSHASIIAKLTLLCMHFPQMRVLWSRDAEQTAQLFASLKAGLPEPDVRAVKTTEEELESRGNEVPGDILRRIPGVTRANVRALLDHVPSLRALSQMSVDAIDVLVHSRADAVRIHAFFQRDLRAAPPPPRTPTT